MPSVDVNQQLVNEFLEEHAEELGLKTELVNPLLMMVSIYTDPTQDTANRLAAANKCLPYLWGHPPDPDNPENQFDDPAQDAQRNAVYSALINIIQNPAEAPNIPMPSATSAPAPEPLAQPSEEDPPTVTDAEIIDPEQASAAPETTEEL